MAIEQLILTSYYFIGLFLRQLFCMVSPESNILYLLSCLQTDVLLEPSKLVEMSVGGGAARLTLPNLAKDDEGLYTLRIFTKDGTTEHSAYLFVSGTSLTAKNSQQPLICFDDSCLCYYPSMFLSISYHPSLCPSFHMSLLSRCHPPCGRGPWCTTECEGL